MLRYLLLIVLTGFAGSSIAQEILGKVTDSKKEPLVNASVRVLQGGILKSGVVTDFDGNFSIKPLDPGTYDVEVSYTGLQTKTIRDVQVSPGGKAEVDAVLAPSDGGKTTMKEVVVTWKKPLQSKYNVGSSTLDAKQIKNIATTQVTDLVATTPGIYQNRRGAAISSDGGRTSGNLYIIDGVQVQGTVGIDMAQGSIDGIQVMSSGIPANYGDVSGAVINITSKGVARKLNGNVRLQTSADGYNNNLASFSMAGPLLKVRSKDSNVKEKIPVMGFALSGDLYEDHNRYPTYQREFVTKSDVMAELLKNPLKIISDNSGQPVYNLASAYVTSNQLTTVKTPPKNVTQELRLNGKVNYKVSDNIEVAAGGMIDFLKQDLYSRGRNLFASDATPVQNSYTSRGYLRFRQTFGKQNANDTTKHIISNAYYTVQLDYQKLFQNAQDPTFKKDIFKYSYIGKFDKQYQDIYLPNQTDSLTGTKGTVLFVKVPTGVKFTRSELNPNLANYTSQYYRSLNDALPFTINRLQANNALANGDAPANTYGLFLSPGSTISSYSDFTSTQYALSIDAAFDLKAGGIKHGIEFGLYYQQRIQRSYAVAANQGGTSSLWQLMRQLVSNTDNGGLKLDKTNPVFRVNNQNYTYDDVKNGVVIPGPTDTIMYNYINPVQSAFDKNLRKKLGLSATENINIDMLDPSQLSLNMFSADELINSGNPFINYYGYTYTGGAQTGTVNFNDFWTQKDANGNYTRPIGAFSPNYIAGYVLDKFEYKNIYFNIGARVERYSANTKVLKDPFSLYGTRSVNEVDGSRNFLNGGKHPSNMGSDYVVYVDDNNSSNSSVVGYRTGTKWYDATGKFIQDPSILKDFTGGRDPQPVLINNTKITDTGFNPNLSFTDYNPQVTVMPRVQVSFPITATSTFFAHYDIYVQRPYPTALGIATAYDYYYLNQNSNQIISNANLRSQKTFDYELGFEQMLGDDAVLKIIGYYKERKDMITVVPYLYAWPTTYYTYGNRDFSSTKGVKLNYEMRATPTSPLRLTLSYTLQFAEGTGSNPFSTNAGGGGQISPQGLLQSFIEAGLPNLRYISALDVDSRHIIVGNFDFRYDDQNPGPAIGGKHIFKNAGINVVTRARSGEPYTRLANAQGNTVLGTINGARLPWHFGMDLRLNKDFAIRFNKGSKIGEDGIKTGRLHKFTAFVYMNNVLNTREVMGVYGYTGKPDDNGFLASPFGIPTIAQQISPQSYTDLYRIATNGAGNLNYARTINFGLEYNF